MSSDLLQMLYECWKQMKHYVGALDLRTVYDAEEAVVI
jgi:hypothetical protein